MAFKDAPKDIPGTGLNGPWIIFCSPKGLYCQCVNVCVQKSSQHLDSPSDREILAWLDPPGDLYISSYMPQPWSFCNWSLTYLSGGLANLLWRSLSVAYISKKPPVSHWGSKWDGFSTAFPCLISYCKHMPRNVSVEKFKMGSICLLFHPNIQMTWGCYLQSNLDRS